MKNFVIEKKYDNKKLVTSLLDMYPNLKNSTINKALRKKDILVNNKRISENIMLHENDNITIYITDDNLYGVIDKIYEDGNILVVNKPIGIEEETLTELLNAYPCHRLDRNTTGLVLYAKNEKTLNILLDKFKNHEIQKYYVAIVDGLFKQKQSTLNAHLFKDNKKSLVYISETSKKGYVPITTSYKVLNENKNENMSLLEITLETGRTHQIRAHMAHIGHPIIGDSKYGKKRTGFKSQLLMAYKLCFDDKVIEIDYSKFNSLFSN